MILLTREQQDTTWLQMALEITFTKYTWIFYATSENGRNDTVSTWLACSEATPARGRGMDSPVRSTSTTVIEKSFRKSQVERIWFISNSTPRCNRRILPILPGASPFGFFYEMYSTERNRLLRERPSPDVETHICRKLLDRRGRLSNTERTPCNLKRKIE